MNFLKAVLRKNLFVYDFVLRIRFHKNNRAIKKFTNEISKIDSILDYDSFVEKMKQIPSNKLNDVYSIKRVFGESLLYGHGYSLLQFANLSIKNIKYLPILEHGIPYSNFDSSKYKVNNAYIFQGKNNDLNWRKTKNNPAYYVGPYIHYCDYVYDKQKISDLKKEMGKTLLLFLPHSIETKQFSIDVNNIITGIEKACGKVDTILACVYCMDCINMPRIEGINIRYVSAGFKLDWRFVSRLKTIIELADIVYYTSFSSSIGYAFYLNKQIICNPNAKDYEQVKKEIGEESLSKLELFNKLFGPSSKATYEEKVAFINHYWGLDEIKTKEEIRSIVVENKKRIRRKLGFY